MSLYFFTSLALALTFTLLLASTPLLLGAWILLLTFAIASLFSFISATWLGIFSLLIYVGGLLVIFAYFVALAPNQILEAKTMILSTLSLFSLFFITSTSQLSLFSSFSLDTPSVQPPITNLLSLSNTMILISLALILFFTLVAVVKIRTRQAGPLRPWK